VSPDLDGFRDLVPIGRGGFGMVYRGYEEALQRSVAIKFLTGPLDSAGRARFSRERLAMSRLSEHPNVVAVYRSGVAGDGAPYLVMPYLAGGSLADRLAAGGPIGWSEAASIGIRIAGALETAHRLGIVHRDVKPANILRSDYGEPLLTDFGIARVSGGYETTSGEVTASVCFAGPELLEGGAPTPAADVYSLGATVFALLTGQPPFQPGDGEQLASLYLRIARDPVPDLRRRGVPSVMCDAIEQALSKRASQRPTVVGFARALQDSQRAAGERVTDFALGGDTVATPPAPQRAIKRRPGRPIALAAAVLLVALLAAVGYVALSGGRAARSTVDATPRAGDVTLGPDPVQVPVRLGSGRSAQIRVAGQAGQRLIGSVHSRSAATAVPISVLAGTSPLEQTALTGFDAYLDAVQLPATGTYVVQLGPVSGPLDATVELGLAPSDVRVRTAVGAPPARVVLSQPRQLAYVTFAGRAGQVIRVTWTWSATPAPYVSLGLQAPDGTDLAGSGWSAQASFRSPAVRLRSDGDYVLRASVDGGETGSALVQVTSAR
jgi:hypothetical protein